MSLYIDITPYFWITEDKGGIYHYIDRFINQILKENLTQKYKITFLIRGYRVIDKNKVDQYYCKIPLKWLKIPGHFHRYIPLIFGGQYITLWDNIPKTIKTVVYAVIHDLRALIYKDKLEKIEKELPLYKKFCNLKEYKLRKQYFYKKERMLEETLLKSEGIIAISKFTANTIKQLGLFSKRLTTVYHGILPKYHKNDLPIYLKNKTFILYVGKIDPLKNIEGLLLAFHLLRQKNPEIYLVLAGPLTWYGRFLRATWPHKEGIFWLDFVSNELLESLYEKAQFLILPSFYEGFGLPLLEAMSRGLPTVVSNKGALPEIGGEASIYFDPYDYKDIANKIEEILFSPLLKKSLKEKGIIRSKTFSWKECVNKTLTFVTN